MTWVLCCLSSIFGYYFFSLYCSYMYIVCLIMWAPCARCASVWTPPAVWVSVHESLNDFWLSNVPPNTWGWCAYSGVCAARSSKNLGKELHWLSRVPIKGNVYTLLTLLAGCDRCLTSCIHRIQMRTRLHKELQYERHVTLTILGIVDLRYQCVQRCVACSIDSNYRSAGVHQYQCGGIAGKS